MNLVFLSGKIVSEIKYRFIIRAQNKAIVEFKIKCDNNIFDIQAYDEIADLIYRQNNIYDGVLVYGKIVKQKYSKEEIIKNKYIITVLNIERLN